MDSMDKLETFLLKLAVGIAIVCALSMFAAIPYSFWIHIMRKGC